MAVPVRTRKQWQLQDGPHGTLRRLRSQLAEDGCPESQLILAKCLLNEAEGDEAKEKESKAVSWLIKAAEQNNEEADCLLRECLRTKRGLNTRNYKDVLYCLNMSQEEKEARQAARALFNEMTSDGKPVTSGKLLQKLHQSAGCNEKVDNEDYLTSTHSQESFLMKFLCEEGSVYTEEDLLDLASEITNGKNPNYLMEQELEAEYFKKLSLCDKICTEPGLTFRVAYVQLLEWCAAVGNKVIRWIFTPGIHHFTILLFLHWAISFKTMMMLMPIVIFYFALLIMITSTINMLCFRQRLRGMKQWTHLLSLFSKTLARERIESLYVWKTYRPYILFFLGIIALIFVYPLVPKFLIPSGYLTVIAFTMMVTAFVSLNNCYDKLIILSMGMQIFLQVIPRLLYTLSPWDYPGDTMPCFGVILLGSHIRIHIGIPSLFYLFIPLIFMLMAVRNTFKGAIRVFIPHLVCILWWQITMLFFTETSLSNLVLSSLVLAGIIFLIPLVGVTCILLIVILINQLFGQLWILLHAIGFVIFISFPSLLANQMGKNYIQEKKHVFIMIKIISYMFAFFLLMSFYFSLSSHSPTVNESSSIISWENYYQMCHKPAWEQKMVVQVELQCVQLSGGRVMWDGTAEIVRVDTVTNKLIEAISFLPCAIQDFIKGILGTPFDENVWPNASTLMANTHDISYWNRYTFELVLLINLNHDMANVFVMAGEEFRSFLIKLKQRDRVRVGGILMSGLGGPRPKLQLTSIQCLACSTYISPAHKENGFHLSRGFKFLVHFLFSPLIEYHETI